MGYRVLGRILAAQALSSIGTSMSTVALAFMVYQLTHSVLQMGGVMAVSTFPLVVTSILGGALLDRFSAKSAMVLADVARAGLIFMMPFVAQQAVGLIYVVAGLIGLCSALFNPGQIKLIGELTEREFLVRANSYLSVSRDGAELIGYLLGGVLVTYVGYTMTFGIDAASYVISALLLLGLPRALPRTEPVPKLGPLIAESPAVFRRLWKHPALRVNLLFATFASGAVMMSVPNSYGLALKVFSKGSQGLAALEVLTASGLIVGGLIISRMKLGGDKNRYVFFSVIAMSVCMIGVSFSDYFWLSAGLIGLAGIANVGTFVPSITMFQEVPAEADKGRLIAVRAGFGQMGATSGLLLGGALGQTLGITRMFMVAGLIAVGLSLVIYLPYHLGAARRARLAWTTALETGERRAVARAAAQMAAIGGILTPQVSAASAAMDGAGSDEAVEAARKAEDALNKAIAEAEA